MNIALLAHDRKKELMVQFCIAYCGILAGHNICATNTTGRLVDGEEWEYEILLDPNSEFRRAMGVQMIPHVFIIGGDGKVVESRSGYTDGGENHLIEKIRELVSK